MSDLYDSIPNQVGSQIREAVTAWQATADNRVTRHYAPRAGASAVNAGEQVRVVDHKLRTLQNLLGTSRKEVDELEKRIRDLVHDFRAPESELATANQALIDLQRRNDSVIKECRRWKERAKEAEAALKELQKAQPSETPVEKGIVSFLRRTPGDAIRYFAQEIMKHADDNAYLAGAAMGLRMVADDVDRLPQGERP
jgi:DNA repair ATPase RecN